MLYPSRVVIDGYKLSPQDVQALGSSLNLYRRLAVGELNEVGAHVGFLLARELWQESGKIDLIKGLIQKANCVLWEGRRPWTIYAGSASGLNAYSLEARLKRDQEEIAHSVASLNCIREANNL